jgi:hypothetical protein
MRPFFEARSHGEPTINKTDLSLILSALGLAISLGLGFTAAALLAGYLAGLLTASQRRGP